MDVLKVITDSILRAKSESHGKAIGRYGQEKEHDSKSEPMRDRSIRRKGSETVREKTGKNNMLRGKLGTVVVYVAKFLLSINSQTIVLFLQITRWRLCCNLQLNARD
jgi:hypothetical protein